MTACIIHGIYGKQMQVTPNCARELVALGIIRARKVEGQYELISGKDNQLWDHMRKRGMGF